MRHLICSLVMFFCFTPLFSQNTKFQAGQILLRNGEKKTGMISGQFYLEEPRGVYFKANENDKVEYLEFETIQEISFGALIRYISYCTKNTAQERCRWLQTLIQGKVSLYQGIADEALFFLEEAGTYTAIRSQSFEGFQKVLKQKCPGLATEMFTKFTPQSLIKIVGAYSQCKFPRDTIKYYKEPQTAPLAQWYIGPKFGINSGNASIYKKNYYGRGKYTGSPALTTGFIVQMRIDAHWAALAELIYFQRSIQSDSVNVWPIISSNYSKIKIELGFIEVPLQAQYLFSKNKVSPFLQAGLHIGIPLTRKLSEQMVFGTPQEIAKQPKTSFVGPGFGYGGGIGINANISEKMRFQVLGQYTRFSTTFNAKSTIFGTSTGNESESPLKMNRLQLAVSLLCKL